MKKLLKKLMFVPLMLMASCATGPSYLGGPIVQPDPMKTVCTQLSIPPSILMAENASKEPGNCMTGQLRVTDPNKPFTCVGKSVGSGGPISFIFDVLSSKTSYKTRLVVHGSPSTSPFEDQVTLGKERVTISGKALAPLTDLEILAPMGMLLGDNCWTTITNVE